MLLLLFFTTWRCKANTIFPVRSKYPEPFCQLVPHLQCFSPMNCCFIARPHWGHLFFFLGFLSAMRTPHIAYKGKYISFYYTSYLTSIAVGEFTAPIANLMSGGQTK